MSDHGNSLIQRAAERLRKQRPGEEPVNPPEPAAVAAPAPASVAPRPDPFMPMRHQVDDNPRISREVRIDRQRLAKSGITFTVTERSRIAEEFRIVTRQILAKAEAADKANGSSRLIMVTSARPREGKTFTAINLALAISSQADFRVLAVDCDVDR